MEAAKVLAAVPALERKTDFFEGTTAGWHLAHPYPMPPNFTGRATELKILDNWLTDNKDRLFILRALGGFGKSALAWQWINTHVNPTEWTKLVWWSFYEGDASFEHFIEETLKYLNLEPPQGQRPQVDALFKAMQGGKILLVMDGFERALRAYSSMNAAYQGDDSPLPSGEGQGEGALDCVNLNAEIFLKHLCSLPNIKSKVLMTTRLTPRAVKPRGEFMLGCREVELTSMQPADAVEFFHKQKIKGTHAEIEAACAPMVITRSVCACSLDVSSKILIIPPTSSLPKSSRLTATSNSTNTMFLKFPTTVFHPTNRNYSARLLVSIHLLNSKYSRPLWKTKTH